MSQRWCPAGQHARSPMFFRLEDGQRVRDCVDCEAQKKPPQPIPHPAPRPIQRAAAAAPRRFVILSTPVSSSASIPELLARSPLTAADRVRDLRGDCVDIDRIHRRLGLAKDPHRG